MKLLCNRFAIIPRLCKECKRYVWLESYRRSEVWKYSCNLYVKENICKDCLSKFDIVKGENNNEHV